MGTRVEDNLFRFRKGQRRRLECGRTTGVQTVHRGTTGKGVCGLRLVYVQHTDNHKRGWTNLKPLQWIKHIYNRDLKTKQNKRRSRQKNASLKPFWGFFTTVTLREQKGLRSYSGKITVTTSRVKHLIYYETLFRKIKIFQKFIS